MAHLRPSDLASQKKIIERYLKQNFKAGDSWCLLEWRWYQQWQKYVGFPRCESFSLGDQSDRPGPIDNCPLFKPGTSVLREDLKDSIDYVLMPIEAYNKLASWYGVTPGQDPVIRKMIEQTITVKRCKVEVYLVELKLCESCDTTSVIIHPFSRADTIGTVESEMRRIYVIPKEKKVQLWKRFADKNYELLRTNDRTIQDAGLYHGQVIVIEVLNDDGTWPRKSQGGPGYRGAGCSSNVYSGDSVNNYYNSFVDRSGTRKPGLCGLVNLGNTCFMNSVLQCMFNVSRLTDYMLSNKWEQELNKENPSGMNGEIASTYAELIREVWSGQRCLIEPRNFKNAVGRFAPQFSGCQKHDSQELMSFLLDGLHEDLNRIKQKTYKELNDSGGRPDKVVAKEAWASYKQRNDSVIVDIFHGLLKSTIRCQECDRSSVIFDPFCYLSLPVKEERLIDVAWIPLAPEKTPMRVKLAVPKAGAVRDLCLALKSFVNVSSDKMIVTEVFNNRFYKLFQMEEDIHNIMDADTIFIYEIPDDYNKDPNTILLGIYFRNNVFGYKCPLSIPGQHLFGHPMLLAVSKDNCTYDQLYHLLLRKMSRFVKVPESGDDGKETIEAVKLKMEIEASHDSWSFTDGNENEVGQGARASTTKEQDASGNVETTSVQVEDKKPGDNKMNPEDNVDACTTSPSTPVQKKKHIFTLKVTNMTGDVSGRPVLVDDGNPLPLMDQTYIAVHWSIEEKNKFLDERAAEAIEEHESMYTRPKKTVLHLEDCLKLFLKEEQLDDKDPWFCPNCKEHRQATKKFDLWSLPEVLIIHLKRFSYSRTYREKIDTLVKFPTRGLDLCKNVINEESSGRYIYDLIAVTNHGSEGGHYTACAKNKVDANWYYFDDSTVTSTSEGAVCTKDGYVLMYQRKLSKRKRKELHSNQVRQTKLPKVLNSSRTDSKVSDASATN